MIRPEDISDATVRAYLQAEQPDIAPEHLAAAVISEGAYVRRGLVAAHPHLLRDLGEAPRPAPTDKSWIEMEHG